MKVIVNGKLEDLGAHIKDVQECLVPNFVSAKYAEPEPYLFDLPAEDYAMWNEACEASGNLDELYSYCEGVFGWDMY